MDKDEIELLEYKKELLSTIEIESMASSSFAEVQFLSNIGEMLAEAGIYENIEEQLYRNKGIGMKIDGFSYNPTEKTLYGLVVSFSNDKDALTTISKSELETLGKQTAKFLEKFDDEMFLKKLALTSPGRILASSINDIWHSVDPETNKKDKIQKFKVAVITDHVMSDRIKDPRKLTILDIREKESSFEVWDLKRIQQLDTSGNESEPIEIDFGEYLQSKGLETIAAGKKDKLLESYLCILPGQVLWKLFDDYGQRLLESNVRTFLSFRGSVNNGMRKTLLKNPENFFAYNNGLTVTASNIKTTRVKDSLLISHLSDMQIVNGGQTTSTIYFAPLEKGSQEGINYKDIDLSRVFVQMKLSVLRDQDKSNEMKTNIAMFANTQNAIQKADLVSNHPFHVRLQELSRNHFVPPGELGTPSKWFYERSRGQYDTELRAIPRKIKKDAFILENPKEQRFTKTDMAKYENTFRMRPYHVTQGAQKNLQRIGETIIEEWEKDSTKFEYAFYKDLISKAILFRQTEKAISGSDWYKLAPGYRADIVTYSLSLLRHIMRKENKDLSLARIYEAQKLSDSLKMEIVSIAYEVRKNLMNEEFRNGVLNPSSFGKTQIAWQKFQTIHYELSHINKSDWISTEELKNISKDNKALNQDSASVSLAEQCLEISSTEWANIYDFLKTNNYYSDPKGLKILEKLSSNNDQIIAKLIFPEDFELALYLKNKASDFGYLFEALK